LTARQVRSFDLWASSLQEDRNQQQSDELARISPRAAVDVQLRMERAAKVKVEREKLEGKLVSREEIQHEMAAILHALKNTVMGTTKTIRPALAKGLKDKIDRALRQALRECAQAMEDAVKDMPS